MKLSRAACFFNGHKRGKKKYQGIPVDGRILVTYACSRCGAEWTRKIKATSGEAK